MRFNLRFLIALVVMAAAATLPAQTTNVDEVLTRAGEYVVRYQHAFAGVVAQETYKQTARPAPRFDPNGSLKSGAEQHREISKESARYNVGSVIRNVNVPVLALWVLMPQNQHRFLFNHVEAADAGRTDGAWALDYREIEPGTMIRTTGGQDLPVRGRFWVNPITGGVLGSTIVADDRNLSATIDVTYQLEPALHMLVPQDMRESYEQRADGSTVTGVATYANFRQFQVKVDEKIAPVKQQ